MISIHDCPGLVEGSSAGEGLGNAFLETVEGDADGMYHIVRAFPQPEVDHPIDHVDPIRDIQVVNKELRMRDEQRCQEALEKLKAELHEDERKGTLTGKEKARALEDEALGTRALAALADGTDLRDVEWSGRDVEYLNKHQFVTAKPVLYCINVGTDEYKSGNNAWLPKI